MPKFEVFNINNPEVVVEIIEAEDLGEARFRTVYTYIDMDTEECDYWAREVKE